VFTAVQRSSTLCTLYVGGVRKVRWTVKHRRERPDRSRGHALDTSRTAPVLRSVRGSREAPKAVLLSHSFRESVPSRRVCRKAADQRFDVEFRLNVGASVRGRDAVCAENARTTDWFARFSAGKESVEDEPRSGGPSTSRTAENIGRACEWCRC